MMWELRYTPGTRYGDAFPSWRFGQRRTFEAADATRMQCAHPESIEVVPVEIDSVNKGIRETIRGHKTNPQPRIWKSATEGSRRPKESTNE